MDAPVSCVAKLKSKAKKKIRGEWGKLNLVAGVLSYLSLDW